MNKGKLSRLEKESHWSNSTTDNLNRKLNSGSMFFSSINSLNLCTTGWGSWVFADSPKCCCRLETRHHNSLLYPQLIGYSRIVFRCRSFHLIWLHLLNFRQILRNLCLTVFHLDRDPHTVQFLVINSLDQVWWIVHESFPKLWRPDQHTGCCLHLSLALIILWFFHHVNWVISHHLLVTF